MSDNDWRRTKEEEFNQVIAGMKELYPGVSVKEKYLKQAVALTGEKRKGEKFIELILNMAKNFEKAEQAGFIPPIIDEGNTPLFLENAPVLSRVLAEKFSYKIKRIRESLFKSEEPPFKFQDEAVSWIKKMATKEPHYAVVETVIDKDTEDKIYSSPVTPENPILIRAVGVRNVFVRRELLEYPGPDGEIKQVLVSPQGNNYWSPILGRLKVLSEELSRDTGWQEAQAVMHILTGKIPLLPPVKTTIRDQNVLTKEGWVNFKQAIVTFLGFDLTRGQLIQLHSALREMLGVKHQKAGSKKQELINFVREEKDKVKCKNAPEFWLILARGWAEKRGIKPTRGASFQKRYVRACDKLGLEPLRFRRKK